MVNPITPEEAKANKKTVIPDEVIDVFNQLIIKYFDGRRATFRQREAVDLIMFRMKVSDNQIFANHWLDVEAIFEKSGWRVEYDKPGFNETYPATFAFSKR